MSGKLNYLELFLPNIEQAQDNTAMATRQFVDKEKAPIVWEPTPVITQGKTTSESEGLKYISEANKKKIELKEQQQKEAEKKVKALESVNNLLDFLSPAKHYEQYTGKDLDGVKEFVVDVVADPVTYASLGALPLIKKISKEVTEKLTKKVSTENIKKNINNITQELSKKITDLERLGVPKGERNQKQFGLLGTVDDNQHFKIVDSDLFGSKIDAGGEQIVFNNVNNPQQVLKVYVDRKFTSVDDIKKFHKNWFKRNQIPNAAKIKYIGYLKGKERLYPVYSQQKLHVPNDEFDKWNVIHLPRINQILHNAGYNGNGMYYGKFTIGDVNPNNIGYDDLGNLYFTDVDVYKKGGLFQRK